MQKQTSTKTSGWVIFSGVFAAIAAFGNLLYGLTLLLNDEWLVLTPRAAVAFDLTTIGASYLILGALLMLIAMGIFNGDLWARVLGITVAALNIVAQMAFMSVYPEWSWLSIAVNGLIIYGLAVHGDEVAEF